MDKLFPNKLGRYILGITKILSTEIFRYNFLSSSNHNDIKNSVQKIKKIFTITWAKHFHKREILCKSYLSIIRCNDVKVSYTFKKYIEMPESRALVQVENIIWVKFLPFLSL